VSSRSHTARTFGVNVLLLFAINAIVKPFYLFGIDRTVQNEVGSGSYGIFATLFSFIFLFQIFADVGLQNFSQQWISRQRGSVSSTLSKTLGLKILLSGVFLLLVLAGGAISGYLLKYPLLFGILTINLLLNSWLLYLRTKVSGLGYYKTDSVISAMDKLWMIGIMAFLLWGWEGHNVTIYEFAFAQLLAYLLTIAYVFIWIFAKIKPIRINWRAVIQIAVLKKAVPFALVVFLMTLFTRIDVVMIENLLPDGFYQVGAYWGGMRLLDAVNIAGYLVAGLLLPMFSNASRTEDAPVDLARAGWHFMMSAAIPLAFICYVYGEEIARLLYVDADEEWGKIISILLLTFVVRSSDYVFGSLLTAYKKLAFMNRIFVGAVLLNVVLNLILLPRLDALGAAYATLITQGTVAVVFIIYAHHKILQVSIWKTLIRPLVLTGGLLIISVLMEYTDWIWLWEILFIIGASLILSVALGMLSSITTLIKPRST
jgi:O-antigen/teichoic acid export membrane protein